MDGCKTGSVSCTATWLSKQRGYAPWETFQVLSPQSSSEGQTQTKIRRPPPVGQVVVIILTMCLERQSALVGCHTLIIYRYHAPKTHADGAPRRDTCIETCGLDLVGSRRRIRLTCTMTHDQPHIPPTYNHRLASLFIFLSLHYIQALKLGRQVRWSCWALISADMTSKSDLFA